MPSLSIYQEGGLEAAHTHLEWTKVHVYHWSCPRAVSTPFPSVTIYSKGTLIVWKFSRIFYSLTTFFDNVLHSLVLFVFLLYLSGKIINLRDQLLAFSMLILEELKAVLGSNVNGKKWFYVKFVTINFRWWLLSVEKMRDSLESPSKGHWGLRRVEEVWNCHCGEWESEGLEEVI